MVTGTPVMFTQGSVSIEPHQQETHEKRAAEAQSVFL